MKMSGTRQIAAPQAEVWAKLNDVDVLKRCIPGCESLEKTAENELKSTVALKIGPMNVRFNGNVTLSDLDPPNAYRISGKGQGGAAGFASGGANVKLAPQGANGDGGTLLSYDVDATVGGKIAQLGARLIDATAASLANQFFDRFAAEMAPAAGSTPPAAATPAPAAADRPAQPQREVTMPTRAPSTGSTWLWWAGAVVVAIIIYFLLRR